MTATLRYALKIGQCALTCHKLLAAFPCYPSNINTTLLGTQSDTKQAAL